ncbi:MAG TPA: hypothetical protein VF680_01150 [Allosphingosinicella sp.]|jgi:hypothetical protein
MSEDDRNYYRRRAEEEIGRAQASLSAVASRLHYLLGGFYLDRAFNPQPQDHSSPGENGAGHVR